jgi:hypothetical protein
MQTNLGKNSIESRENLIVKNEYCYYDDNQYSVIHKNASNVDEDAKGKGTGHGGHTHYRPDPSAPKGYVDEFGITQEGGNYYDIHGYGTINGGRNFLKNISMYSKEKPYYPNNIDTSNDGTIRIEYI